MKLYLLNTREGLKPMYDEDYDEKKKLKIGEVYEAEIRQPRNLRFHRKYFALLVRGNILTRRSNPSSTMILRCFAKASKSHRDGVSQFTISQ